MRSCQVPPFWKFDRRLNQPPSSNIRKGGEGVQTVDSTCARKVTVDINILVTSRNGKRKIMQPRAFQLAQKNIYQSNTYKKDLGLLHLSNEQRTQEKQQVRAKSLIYLFRWLIQHLQVALGSTSSDTIALLHIIDCKKKTWQKKSRL